MKWIHLSKGSLVFLFFLSLRVCAQPEVAESVKGTWITNVGSEALHSRANIKKVVQQCRDKGLNHIFVVVWNGGYTLYPSTVQETYIGVRQHPDFAGRDPLKEIVEEGHAVGLKVHAWFEFGFSYAYKDSNNLWLQRYPGWAGRNNKGDLLKKNGFYWWNAVHPSPQQFLKSLVLEVVGNYEVDGVQGDDRLPAMPGEGGYDAYTMALYASEHQGAKPPLQPKERNWVDWKARKLSLFGKELYHSVKQVRSTCLVSWAPSIYPWSKEEYLQDWPTWLKEGYADLIIPQLYRYSADAYSKVLKQLEEQVPASLRKKIFPGILTSLGDGYQATDTLIGDMIRMNRAAGFEGEVFFYYETLNRLKGPLYKN